MCNVVALTFYATIYETFSCNCNKYIGKKKHIHSMVSFMTLCLEIPGSVGVGEGLSICCKLVELDAYLRTLLKGQPGFKRL